MLYVNLRIVSFYQKAHLIFSHHICVCCRHYNDVIMSLILRLKSPASRMFTQPVCSDVDQRKHQSSASLAFVGNSPRTGEFPTQRAINAENVSIWWRNHVILARETLAHSLQTFHYRISISRYTHLCDPLIQHITWKLSPIIIYM